MNKIIKKQMLQEEEYDFPYHYLDLKADEYKLIRRIEYLSYLGIVKNLLKPFTGQSVLDAGCGDGRFCYELRNENVNFVGVDFSERAIGFARAFNPNVEFFIQDLKRLNLPYKFDYIVMIETLEHFIPNHIPQILENLYNKDGKLIITVPSKNRPLKKKHYQHFTEESLRNTLKDHFKIVKAVGYSRTGFRRKIFTNLTKLSILLFSLRKKINVIMRFYQFLSVYYTKHLEMDQPEDCYGLIAICEKKENRW